MKTKRTFEKDMDVAVRQANMLCALAIYVLGILLVAFMVVVLVVCATL